MFQDLSLTAIAINLVVIFTAITLHELGHAWSADKLGDDTARRLGRVTLNPVKHIDPLGTILVPGLLILSGAPFLFGWAKPVPVMFSRLGTRAISRRAAIALVALAGPAANILIATTAAVLAQATGIIAGPNVPLANTLFLTFIVVNVFFAIFNLIPIPPLDGGRIATSLLPAQLAWPFSRLEPYGFFIVIGLLVVLPSLGQAMGIPLNFLMDALVWVFRIVVQPFIALSGLV